MILLSLLKKFRLIRAEFFKTIHTTVLGSNQTGSSAVLENSFLGSSRMGSNAALGNSFLGSNAALGNSFLGSNPMGSNAALESSFVGSNFAVDSSYQECSRLLLSLGHHLPCLLPNHSIPGLPLPMIYILTSKHLLEFLY